MYKKLLVNQLNLDETTQEMVMEEESEHSLDNEQCLRLEKIKRHCGEINMK